VKRERSAVGGVFAYRARGRVRWGVDHRDATGAKRRKVGFATKHDAVAWLQDHTVEPDGPRAERRRLGKSIATYVAERTRDGRHARSYAYLELWAEALGDRELHTLHADELEELLDRWTEERHLSPASRNRLLAQLSGFFSWALKRRLLRRHPTKDVLVYRQERNARTRWLRREEIDRIAKAAPAWLADIVHVATATGMRLGEIVSLTKASYETDDHGRAWLVTRRTKNGDPLFWPLEGWLLDDVKRRVKRARFPGELLYPGPGRPKKGGGRHPGGTARTSIRRALPAAVRAAGLTWGRWRRLEDGTREEIPDGVTFHTFRHSMASAALGAGLPQATIQQLGNWRDPKMVRRYAHLADEAFRSAAGQVVELARPKRRRQTGSRRKAARREA